MIHFVLFFFFFCFCCLGKQEPKTFSSFLWDVSLFHKHIKRAVSTQAISSILQWLSCAPLMREKGVISGGPQEASVGDNISLTAVCHLNRLDKSKPE